MAPNFGQVGTLVTISGTNMRGAGLVGDATIVEVQLAGTVARIIKQTNTIVEVEANHNNPVVGAVTLIADTGAVVELESSWNYTLRGEISQLVPSSGQVGTRAVIEGVWLLGAGSSIVSITLGAVEVDDYANVTESTIDIVAAKSTAGTVDVLLTANTGARVTKVGTWEYLDQGEITLMSPNSGQAGTVVEIYGQRLFGGGATVFSVTLAGTPVADVLLETSTLITVEANSGSPGNGHVIVVSDTGAIVTLENGFTTYVDGEITDVSPNEGQIGTEITISGTGLLGLGKNVTSLTLNSVPILTLLSYNDTMMVVVANYSIPTSGAIVITADTGAYITKPNAWTYLQTSAIVSVQPDFGQYGTQVLIQGTDLLGGFGGTEITTVTLAGLPAVVKDSNDTMVLIVAQDGTSAGDGDIVVTSNTGAEAVREGGWQYSTRGSITGIAPVIGQGGTNVTLDGLRMLGGGVTIDTITLAGVLADVLEETDEKIVVVAVATKSSLTGPIVIVSNTGAVVQSDSNWTYAEPGAIDLVSPPQGQLGTQVIITGTSLRGQGSNVVSVTLASVAVTITSEEDDEVNVTVVDSGPKTGDVVLVSSSGAIVTKKSGWRVPEPWEHRRCVAGEWADWNGGHNRWRCASWRWQRSGASDYGRH